MRESPRAQRRLARILAILGLSVIAGLGFSLLGLRRVTRSQTALHVSRQGQHALLERLAGQVDALEAEKARTEQRLETLRDIARWRVPWRVALDRVEKSLRQLEEGLVGEEFARLEQLGLIRAEGEGAVLEVRVLLAIREWEVPDGETSRLSTTPYRLIDSFHDDDSFMRHFKPTRLWPIRILSRGWWSGMTVFMQFELKPREGFP